ncbi:hypothetical protein ABK249_19175 [Neorhizobium sp. Rsf11]|uniref:Uncharacterized protein n=1 Tax=Neorhizobium phenanthreniclasticum TaxID=3157917 RepID=A0ABV0M5B4_9HYPH
MNKTTQRGEMITCRGRKPRENAEGHANAEPLDYYHPKFRIRVRFSGPFFENHGRRLPRVLKCWSKAGKINGIDFTDGGQTFADRKKPGLQNETGLLFPAWEAE